MPTSRSERFAVALYGEPGGWLVDARSTEAAVAMVRGAVPRAGEVGRGECLVWTADWYRCRYLAGGDFGPEWVRL